MPIYLVRWPKFETSLVRARDEEELRNMLGEIGDPAACRWMVYNGPLWIDLDLKAEITDKTDRPLQASDVEISGAAEIAASGISYKTSIPGSEGGYEMSMAITKWAFPKLSNAFARAGASRAERDEATVHAALEEDLVDYIRDVWNAMKLRRSTGGISDLLRKLGVSEPPPWLRKQLEDDSE